MAYNFRPKNSKEISAKRKTYSTDAVFVFEYIKENFSETIILDPNTDFKNIKIPRVIEKKTGIAQLKRDMAKIQSIQSLNITFGNGSGTGGSTINAAETAKQENATRFVCEHFIEKNKMPAAADIAKIYPDYDDQWHETFNMQASALKKWLKSQRGYLYSRDDGIMPFLENIAITKCGVATKDSWNPADIYIVKRSKERQIKIDLKKIGDSKVDKKIKLDMLNEYMREKFLTRDLVGISLKKLGRSVSLEETNVTKLRTMKEIGIIKNSIRLNLNLQSNGEFETGEMALKINAGGSEVNIQVRAFSGGVRESTQMDMTGQGAAAKLGKVSAREAIDPFLQSMGTVRRRMGTEIVRVGQWQAKDIKKYVDEKKALEKIRIDGNSIDFGENDWETTLTEAIELEKENNRTASQLSAKLQCFRWVEIFAEAEKKNRLTEFLSILYSGAKKQYASAGPFLKIS
jgi:hypothetical protein